MTYFDRLQRRALEAINEPCCEDTSKRVCLQCTWAVPHRLQMLACNIIAAAMCERARREGVAYWAEGTEIIDRCLTAALAADPADVPFPLSPEEARLWHRAQAVAYEHALAMMGFVPEGWRLAP